MEFDNAVDVATDHEVKGASRNSPVASMKMMISSIIRSATKRSQKSVTVF
jgi:hypothetical protein